MNIKLIALTCILCFSNIAAAKAYTYSRYGSGSNSYISHYSGGTSGGYSNAWHGSRSGYIRSFSGSGGSGHYFGVPNGTSVGSSSFISRKHRGQYQAKLRRARLEQERLNNAPPPCGTYGRAPKSCPTQRYGYLSR